MFQQMINENIAGPMIILFGIIAATIAIGLYVYSSLAWMKIAKKKNHPYPWLAWIPVANISLLLQLGGFHWAWVFLILIPLLGWIPLQVLLIIANWKVFESLNYPGWWALAQLISWFPYVGLIGVIFYLIVLGIVAWGEK